MNPRPSILHILFSLLFVTFASSVQSQDAERFTLEEMVKRAKDRSPSALRALTRKENSYWQYRLFKSNYNPQLR
ncbi:MAG: hypothetical protein ACI942_003377, partial [Planctomycetota bacterium]